MNYKQKLEVLNEKNISVWDVTIANSVQCLFDINIDDEEFEQLCSHASYLGLKDSNNLNPDCYVEMLHALRKEKSWEEIDQMNKWDLLELAAGYAD